MGGVAASGGYYVACIADKKLLIIIPLQVQ